MSPSPCYKCPDNPCKEHDTCERYQKFHRGRVAERRMKAEENAVLDATCLAIKRCKKKKKK